MPHAARVQAAIDALSHLERRAEPRPGAVHLRRDGGLAWILLDGPRAHNALTVTMMRQLAEAVDALSMSDEAVVAVASAHGGTFCAGGHLGQVRESLLDREAARMMTDAMTTVMEALLDLPQLSVAVLEGAAIGGGAELALACDLRVGSPEARVHLAQVRLGVAAGWGGAGRLVRHVGRGRALRLLVRAETVSASEALGLGLIDHITEGDRHAMVRDLLGPSLEHPAEAVRAAKVQVREADDPEGQSEAFLQVWGGPAHRAALER